MCNWIYDTFFLRACCQEVGKCSLNELITRLKISEAQSLINACMAVSGRYGTSLSIVGRTNAPFSLF